MELFLPLSSLVSAIWNHLDLVAVSLIVLTLSLDFMKRRRCWSSYPPGPTSLPFIGTMLQLDFKNPHLSFTQLSKKYGNIYSLQNCWKNVVVLNGFKTMKEALVDKAEDFADRPDFAVYSHFGFGNNQGIVMGKYSQSWKEQKRFTLSILRDFGMGKKTLEQLVTEEAGYLCSAFSSEEGHLFDPHYLINYAVSSIICLLTFGDRFDYKDQKFQKLLCLLEEGLKEERGFLPQFLHVVPVLLHIPAILQKAFKHQKALYNYIAEFVEEHKKTWNPSCKRDIVDAFLEETEKRKEDKDSIFNYNNLPLIIGDLFSAGTETTTTTLRWGLLFMILHPTVQNKVHEEIDTVIGKSRSPQMEDQANMPYTRAVIHETQRFGDIVPINVPHMTYRNTELQGFFIPKATTVIANLSSVLKDETMWEKPHEFYPEHFLDADGQFVKREAFLPFSAGRRICLGEQLARMELFLFFTSLLQRFTFLIPEDQPRPREDGYFAFTLVPHPYKFQAVPR